MWHRAPGHRGKILKGEPVLLRRLLCPDQGRTALPHRLPHLSLPLREPAQPRAGAGAQAISPQGRDQKAPEEGGGERLHPGTYQGVPEERTHKGGAWHLPR